MALIHERLSARFQRWEQRARGWQVHPFPVAPEPLFTPFPWQSLRNQPIIDDGRRPTLAGSLLRSLWRAPVQPAPVPEAEEEPEPNAIERNALVEFPLFLRDSFGVKTPDYAPLLSSVTRIDEPVAFELVGTPANVTAQLVVSAADQAHLQQQLRAIFPEIVCTPRTSGLETAWHAADEGESLVVEFGLGRECMLPLAMVQHDLCVPLIGTLSELREGECGLFQVLFEHAKNPWAAGMNDAITNASGDPLFVNAPELTHGLKVKIARPLFGAVVRVAVRSPDFERVRKIARNLANALSAFNHPNGNELIPLDNSDYPLAVHIEDVLHRQSRRSGMLLNADELLGFIRFPTSAVQSPKFRRQTQKAKRAPVMAQGVEGLALGTNTHAGETTTVVLTTEQRVRHTHIIGASGTGKSTLLFNLIRQDIEHGQGVGVLDPHGDLIDSIMGVIPPERINDVVVFDPSDEEFTVGFNILSAHSDAEKNLLASDLVSVFRRLSTSWGDQMGSVLANAVRAFLESERGGTLADLQRFLLEPAYREQFLATVRDPGVVYYWRKSFPQLAGNKSIGPILTRLDTFLGPKPIRYMVSQSNSKLDFGSIMDTGKIFLAKLSQGAIGKENSFLFGSLLVAKFQQLAMSRQRQEEAARRHFWLYLDEFQDFITSSTAEILRGGRKYRIGLTLAHQELRPLQRDPEVASAVLSNPSTRICFRIGDQDARALESNFSAFEARDLQNLATGDAVCRFERSDCDFNLSVPRPEYPADQAAAARRQEVITASRKKFATPRAEMESAFSAPVPSALPADSTTATGRPRPQAAAGPAGATGASQLQPVAPALPVPEPAPSQVREEKLATPRTELGKGGVQHKAIQLRIKEEAEKFGFRVIIEKQIPTGSIDLVLERDEAALACEITISNTIDYEVGNVAKCFKAGFERLAVVGIEASKLAKLQSAVNACLGPAIAAKTSYFLPDDFLDWLKDLPPPEPPPPNVRISGGWKVVTNRVRVSPEETQAREKGLIKLMAETMKKRKPMDTKGT